MGNVQQSINGEARMSLKDNLKFNRDRVRKVTNLKTHKEKQ